VEAKLLDYDLQRQVYDDLQKIKVFRGYGHGTHVLDDRDATSLSEVVKCLRADIRYFKWRNGVVGHTTVVWSAYEAPSELDNYEDARDLLAAIDENDDTMPPSLVYAAAALLEGCSFVNGAPSSAGVCSGVLDLARQQVGVYCLGPIFHTAVVTTDALKRLGHHDIVASDQSNDTMQQVTSLGFLSEPHTLVTYTQSNEALRVAPFIIDVAVWCDFFSSKAWAHDQVANALQFYFASDNSTHTHWYAQLQDLKTHAQSAVDCKGRGGGDLAKKETGSHPTGGKGH
jgi:myo-inositol-1-phosphate synthase